MGSVRKNLDDLSQVIDYLDRVLAIRLKKPGPEHVYQANSHIHLSIVHEMLGDLSQEIDYHDRALSIRMKKLGPEYVDVAIKFLHSPG